MNQPKKPGSLRDIIVKRRQQSGMATGFVGREEQVNLFRHNLRLPLEDEQRRFLFNVWGQGGVGKTTLLRQFRQVAEETKFVTAYTDETEISVPEVMARFAEQLEQSGHKLPRFSERYKVYRQRRQKLEADLDAPQGLSGAVGHKVAKAGVLLARQIPVGGVLFELMDENAAATQAGEWAAYVAKKLTNRDEVHLVQEPEEVLTPLFLQELCKVAQKTSIVLIFDTYERTEEFLGGWLQEVMEGRYGEAPSNLIIVIAGRQELDKSLWAPYEGLIVRLPLEAFTEEEARQYLASKKITNSHVIDVILHLSGRLPLLVATLASESPNDPNQVGDPSGTAVERLLKWVNDPKQRQVALDAAIPQYFNRDILAQLKADEDTDRLFDWLKEMPFVEKTAAGWTYHEIVRTQMLRYKRRSSPQSWTDLHGKLADYYNNLRNNLRLEEDKRQRDTTWQNYTLNLVYHSLCQWPTENLPMALNEFLSALKNQLIFGLRWAEMILQAGKNTETEQVQYWGQLLVDGLKAYETENYEVTAEMFSVLLKQPEIDAQWRPVALGWRGQTYRSMARYEEALSDFDAAIELAPEDAWAIAGRGQTYQAMRRYPEARRDFSHAIELAPKATWAIAGRGQTYLLMERYQDALQDFNHTIELAPKYAWAIARRGQTYRLMKRYQEALADFDSAIEIDPKDAWTIAGRGMTYRLMRRYQEALRDFDRAIELAPNYAWAIANRGQTYQSMKLYQEALQDFNRAIELTPKDAWAIVSRAKIYRSLERYQEALQDFSSAIELAPQVAPPLVGRGETYRLMKRYQEALQDFNRALELAPRAAWALARRGETYLGLKRYQEAREDFDRAIELEISASDWNLYNRAMIYKMLGQSDKATNDINLAIQLARKVYEKNPKDWNNAFNLALYYAFAGDSDQAKQIYWDTFCASPPAHYIQTALRIIEDFLIVFPQHAGAAHIRQTLQRQLQNR